MKCNTCGNEQAEGIFCQKCGGDLGQGRENQTGEAADHTGEESQTSNEFVEKVQSASKGYWNYFLNYLKQPSQIFQSESKERNNGIISIVLTALLFSLAFYALVKPTLDYIRSFYEVSFLSIVGNIIISFAVIFLVVIALLFFINKLLSEKEIDIHTVISIYGAYLIPVIIINVAALLFAIVSSGKLTVILLSLTVFLVSLLIPLHIITRFLTQGKTKVDSYYGYLIYFGSLALSFFIIGKLFADSQVANLLDFL